MIYDTSGIQQEGRTIEVCKEIRSFTAEHGESKTRKTRSDQKQRQHYNCEHCGKEKAVRKGEANRFCSLTCQGAQITDKWAKCSFCMAKIGIGSHNAAKLLHKKPSQVFTLWQRRGIVAHIPKEGSWYRVAKKIKTQNQRTLDKYSRLWVSEIKSDNNSFPDWSVIWVKEQASRRYKENPKKYYKYQDLTTEQKKEHNKRCHKLRMSCPIKKQKKRDGVKLWKLRNKEKVKQSRLEWIRLNPDKYKEYTRLARTDPKNKTRLNLRKRFRLLMRTTKKGGSKCFSKFIGCTTKQLAEHLESKFSKHMTWDNYGTYWHVDHIIPCSAFDHTDPEQIATCWHYTNLQPLEARANLLKSNKITQPQMQLMLCSTH